MIKHTVFRRIKPLQWAAIVGLGLLLAIVPSAMSREPIAVVMQDEVRTPNAPDVIYEWPLEVGVEWVADYPGTDHDLPCAATNALGVYNTLRGAGWCAGSTDCFAWGNSNAWEQDFKSTAAPGGGNKDNWVDNVDLAFYEGHGNPTLFTFETSTGGGTHDDSWLTYNDVNTRFGYRGWGSKDLEWLGLLSCSVLADSHEVDWSYTMDYLHLLMGFYTTAYDVCGFGQTFAQRVLAGNSIRDAWFIACDQKQPSGVGAKVLGEEYYHLYETIYNQMPDHWQDATYWRSTKVCGSTQPPLYVDPAKVTAMPVFETPPLSLAEKQSKWGQLTTVFGVSPTQYMAAPLQQGGTWTSTLGTHQLEMDSDNGLFYYVDNGALFTPTLASNKAILAPEAAKDIADQFLTSNGLMPGDAQFAEVAPVNLDTIGKQPGNSPQKPNVIDTTTTDYEVIYSRILTAPIAGLAPTDVISYSIVGSGAKLKVYVHATGGAAKVSTPNQPGAVVGAQGGWRRLLSGPNRPQQVQATPVLPIEQIELLFQQLEPQVAYEHIPFDNPTSKTVLTYTLGYWEEATGIGQDVLYPAYVISATYAGTTQQGPWSVTGLTYLPVAPEYMRPFAKIESSSDLSKNYRPGQVVTMTAADASQTLAQLGYDASLNFALGKGPVYTYEWYRGSVSPANFLGAGRNLVYTVTLSSGQGAPLAQTVYLVVVDTLSPHASRNTNLASAQLNVMPPVFLPMVTKN